MAIETVKFGREFGAKGSVYTGSLVIQASATAQLLHLPKQPGTVQACPGAQSQERSLNGSEGCQPVVGGIDPAIQRDVSGGRVGSAGRMAQPYGRSCHQYFCALSGCRKGQRQESEMENCSGIDPHELALAQGQRCGECNRRNDLCCRKRVLPEGGSSGNLLRNDDHVSGVEPGREDLILVPLARASSDDKTICPNNEDLLAIRKVSSTSGPAQVPLGILAWNIGDC